MGWVEGRTKLGFAAPGETCDSRAASGPRDGLVSSPHRAALTAGPARTIDFESIEGLEVTGSHFTHHRKHIQKVVQGHVAIPILGEDLGNPQAERVVLGTGGGEAITG